jgi:serine/threonine protein kinase
MAPEQAGPMNRSIDSRSDLYSLGVTFYEMLTGALPFKAADPMEWVHCHIARQPLPPDEYAAEIPAAFSAVVMKLLAKTAEERYQTASGVEAALSQMSRRLGVGWRNRPLPARHTGCLGPADDPRAASASGDVGKGVKRPQRLVNPRDLR